MSESQFTDKEVTYMATALQCMEGEIPRVSRMLLFTYYLCTNTVTVLDARQSQIQPPNRSH
jgi:hypothetical protein